MFRKIISNRKDTANLFGELKKEFSTYVEIVAIKRNIFLKQYPKQLFSIMIITMIISATLALTVIKSHKAAPALEMTKINKTIPPGIGSMLKKGSDIRELLDLQEQVSILIQKDKLSPADSLFLKKAIVRLQSFNQHQQQKP